MQHCWAYSKQLGRKLAQEVWARKEVSQRQKAIKEILVTFGKHRPPDPLCFQQLPIPLLPLNTHPKMHAMTSFTSKPTDWMRPPAFPTAEISVGELHFSVLLMNYGTRGYNFCFYPKLLFKKAFDITKKSQN